MNPSERMTNAARRIEGLITAAQPTIASINRGIGPIAEHLATRADLGELGTEGSDIADRLEAVGQVTADLLDTLTRLAQVVTGLGAIACGETTLATLTGQPSVSN